MNNQITNMSGKLEILTQDKGIHVYANFMIIFTWLNLRLKLE